MAIDFAIYDGNLKITNLPNYVIDVSFDSNAYR